MTKTNLTEDPNDNFFSPFHQVSEGSVIHNAAYQYLFYRCPSEGRVLSAARQVVHYTLCWCLSHSECSVPMAALREGEAAGPAPLLKILTRPTRAKLS